MAFRGNIENITLRNKMYRKVIHTIPKYMQLVVMSLLPKQEIGMEKHSDVSQFIRVEKGHGIAIIGGKKYILEDGVSIIIPAKTYHNIINTSDIDDMKLYTIYTPPEHPVNTKEKYKK
jgi:mannose-6-phosphate isomerase-like protein (cupin superfamily)